MARLLCRFACNNWSLVRCVQLGMYTPYVRRLVCRVREQVTGPPCHLASACDDWQTAHDEAPIVVSQEEDFAELISRSPEDVVWLVNDLGATMWISTRKGATLEVRR